MATALVVLAAVAGVAWWLIRHRRLVMFVVVLLYVQGVLR